MRPDVVALEAYAGPMVARLALRERPPLQRAKKCPDRGGIQGVRGIDETAPDRSPMALGRDGR